MIYFLFFISLFLKVSNVDSKLYLHLSIIGTSFYFYNENLFTPNLSIKFKDLIIKNYIFFINFEI